MYQYEHDKVVPLKASNVSKKQQVAGMFDDIAGRYDFLNRFLSAGIDVSWRKKMMKELKPIQPRQLLDVATGTGDVALMAYKMLKPEKIIGIDISQGMLKLGVEKIEKAGLSGVIDLQKGDSEAINFPDATFDAVTVAFGVRNFENLEKGLAEIYRVLKPGGKLVVLEFSKPKNAVFKPVYNLYLSIVAPEMAKWISKNKDAYQYLNNSIKAFPERQAFDSILHKTGFTKTYFKPLSLGICCIYCGSK
jgi:demethylmenaquinone methyltransferase/2-methoxy-6-polyprenyl-1,4-benzoquinol methylase